MLHIINFVLHFDAFWENEDLLYKKWKKKSIGKEICLIGASCFVDHQLDDIIIKPT
jgi:hypothetical protein